VPRSAEALTGPPGPETIASRPEGQAEARDAYLDAHIGTCPRCQRHEACLVAAVRVLAEHTGELR
jgi:hypothetical protein